MSIRLLRQWAATGLIPRDARRSNCATCQPERVHWRCQIRNRYMGRNQVGKRLHDVKLCSTSVFFWYRSARCQLLCRSRRQHGECNGYRSEQVHDYGLPGYLRASPLLRSSVFARCLRPLRYLGLTAATLSRTRSTIICGTSAGIPIHSGRRIRRALQSSVTLIEPDTRP